MDRIIPQPVDVVKQRGRASLSDRWPATFDALRQQRRRLKRYLKLALAGILLQATALGIVELCLRTLDAQTLGSGWGGYILLLLFDLSLMIPGYITAWLLPGVVAGKTARDRVTGRWEALALSRVGTADLWCSLVVVPAVPWLALAVALCWPYGWWALKEGLQTGAGRQTVANAMIIKPSFHSGSILWGYPAGAIVSGVAYAMLAAFCGFQAKTAREAVTRTYVVLVVMSYTGAGLSLTSPVLGNWAAMPALAYGMFAEPAALLQPAWMFGGTLYSIRSAFVGLWIVWITVGIFALMALFLGVASFHMARRARRPQE